MKSEDDWLAKLRELHEIDKARQQAKIAGQAELRPETTPERLLQRCKAHELMRQVQKVLLGGGGKLQFYERVGGYEHAIVLMWSGPVSDAAEPASIEDVDASIIVGANKDGVFVNDSKLSATSEDALRQALLELAEGFVENSAR